MNHPVRYKQTIQDQSRMSAVLTSNDAHLTILSFQCLGAISVCARVCRAWGTHNKASVRYVCSCVALLKWGRKNGCPWESGNLWQAGAAAGNIEVLEYLRQDPDIDNNEIGTNTYKEAIRAANLGTLKWLFAWGSKHGCPWISSSLWITAAGAGNIEILDYFLQDPRIDNYELTCDSYTEAIRTDNLAVLEWFRVRDDWSDIHDPDQLGFIAIIAAQHGKVEVLAWINEITPLGKLDSADDICDNADEWLVRAEGRPDHNPAGYSQIIQFAHAHGCLWDDCNGCPFGSTAGHTYTLS